MSKLFTRLYKYRMIIVLPLFYILISIGIFQLYEDRYRCHITAKFDDSGPLSIYMPIYYKGYNIGYTKDVKPSEDYKSTLVKIILYPREPKLPKNIVAKVKKRDTKKDYIELTIPDEPSEKLLKNGNTIEGQPAFDLESFLSNIMDSDMLSPIIDSSSQLLTSISQTSDEMGSFFSNSNAILKENRKNIKHTTKSLDSTTKSLKEIATKLNNSIKEDKINSTMSSVDKSSANILAATENIKNISVNVDTATKNLDQTMAKIDCTISNTNATVSNVKNITGGLCEVLGKRFAGLRIIFGRPMKKNACSKNCTK